MAAAAASQPAADGAASGVPAAAAAADADITMINTIEKNLYHDNSRVTPADVDANPRARRANSKREPTFPMKLHQMLSDPDAEGVVVWLPHGRAWKIINQDKFETGLLGKYFEHGNMSSFMRQVNGWDFRRVVKGADEQSYYHEVRARVNYLYTSEKIDSIDSFLISCIPLLVSPTALSSQHASSVQDDDPYQEEQEEVWPLLSEDALHHA